MQALVVEGSLTIDCNKPRHQEVANQPPTGIFRAYAKDAYLSDLLRIRYINFHCTTALFMLADRSQGFAYYDVFVHQLAVLLGDLPTEDLHLIG